MKDQAQVLYEFSEFRLDPAQRTLMRNGEQMPLTPKVFDTLLFLVQNSGRTLEKDELMKALWPESFVEEGNLSQNVFLLRKTLGDDQNGHCFIQTIPRRGYKFVAPVKLLEIPRHPAQSSLSAEYWSRHSPFRGLQVFEPDDAWLFFGRDSETEELLFRLGQSPILMVIGNSGCGKSSLIRAGLIPALRKGRFPRGDEPAPSWRVAIVRPTGAPFDYLAEVLPSQLAPELSVVEQTEFISTWRKKLPLGGEGLRDAVSALANAASQKSSQTHVLLVVDQFEELFTLTTNTEVRGSYIELLLAASQWDSSVPVHLVLVLRADFYSHCLEYPALSRCLETNLYNVPRMKYDQLREAIERRLTLAGAHAESGLIDSLLDDVGTEPGNLALLEHTLSHLWEKCGGFSRTLTNETYSAIGRLRGALSAHADAVYREIGGDAEKRLVQKIFLELVQLGEGAPDTRRRVRREELFSLGAPEQIEVLLARLAASRLIAISGEGQDAFVEVSHEALIREWSTLRDWITQFREELLIGRRLVQAAQEWRDLERDPGALLQGARLTRAEEWMREHPSAAELLKELVRTSVTARQAATARELRGQRTALAPFRRLFFILAGLLIVATLSSWFPAIISRLADSATRFQIEPLLDRIDLSLGIGFQLIILALLVKRRLHRRFFWFSAYIGYDLVETVLRLAAAGNGSLYFSVYWLTSIGGVILSVMALRESFLSVFRTYARHRWFTPIVWSCVGLALAYSVLRAWAYPPIHATRLLTLIIDLELATNYCFSAVGFLYFLLSWFQKIKGNQRESAIISGFTTIGTLSVISVLIRSVFGTRFQVLSRWIDPVGYVLAEIEWTVGLGHQEQEP